MCLSFCSTVDRQAYNNVITLVMEPAYLIANIMKIPWPNCVEIGELLQCEDAEHRR